MEADTVITELHCGHGLRLWLRRKRKGQMPTGQTGFVLTPSPGWFVMLQDWLELRVMTRSQNRAVNGTDGAVGLTVMGLAREVA